MSNFKEKRKMEKAIIFDFFGTLARTPESMFPYGGERTWQLLKKEGYRIELEVFKRNWRDCLSRMDAESDADCVEFHFFDFVRTFLKENFPSKSPSSHFVKLLAETFLRDWNRGVELFDETTQVIHQLSRNHQLGLISNTHYADLVYQNLTKGRLNDLFEVVITSVEFGIKKPDRRIFERATSLLDVETEDCVYVGDNPSEDYEGAVDVGMEAFLIDRDGRYGDFTGNRISRLEELVPWLSKNQS